MNHNSQRNLWIVILTCFVLVLGSLAAYSGQAGEKRRPNIPERLVGTGVFPDNQFNRDFLHTGRRGCMSCHEDLFSLIVDIGPMTHIAAEVTYGKEDDVKYCLSCHRAAVALTGPKLGDILHAVHYYNTAFTKEYNGHCFSCHATDIKGNMAIFDEVKYDATFGGYVKPNADPTIAWLKKRGFPNGHMIGFDMDKDVKGTISFNQDVTTDMKDAFKVANFDMPDVKPDTYQLIVKGKVKTEKAYTVADLSKMAQAEMTATTACLANPIGGTMISNLKYGGVTLKSILDDVGVRKGANIITFTGVDGWDIPLSLELSTARGAILAISVNGQELPRDLGYPVAAVVPGEGGAMWVKWLGTIEIGQVPEKEIPPACKDFPDSLDMIKVNSGFLVPPIDGTQVGRPVRLEGWAFSWSSEPIKAVVLSGDYGKTWHSHEVPDPVDPYRWVYWKFDWDPPGPGRYLLKVKAVTTGDQQQPKEDNLVLVVK